MLGEVDDQALRTPEDQTVRARDAGAPFAIIVETFHPREM